MDQELIQIRSLILLHLEGQLGETDRLLLEKWIGAHPANRKLFEELTNKELLEYQLHKLRSVDVDAALEQFKTRYEMGAGATKTTSPVHFLRRWQWAAAVLLLVASTVIMLVFSDKSNKKAAQSFSQAAQILPGKNGAILTLADGSQVSLDTIHDGVIALQGGSVAKIVNGFLQYEASGDEVVYNTMSTPTGRRFHLTLPDGTVVWLNSLSSIRFPTVFTGQERFVEITGEAYFEVVSNKNMPFRVKINEHTEVEVLGTSFNINAYRDEQMVKTTLLEGLVNIRSGADASQLNPGQQMQTQPSGGIIKTLTIQNIEEIVAWKDGYFNFNNVGLEGMTRQLKRWYGIEVKFEGPVPEKVFRGELDQGVRLDAVLNWLTDLGIKNDMEGNTLIIYNK